MKRTQAAAPIFVALFFATGVCGLGYQVLWAKRFAAGVGHEFPAVLAVIAAFMGGIAAGAWAYDRIAFLQRTPRAYGYLELIIGAWAASTTILIPAVNKLAVVFLGPDPPAAFHWFVVFAAVFLTLLPATAAMGATFPAIERYLHTLGSGGRVGLLYAANTAGAMTGLVASAFWLMPRFGIARSILALSILNLACGAAALVLARDRPAAAESPFARPAESLLGVRLALTGFFGIGFETVMIRGLSQSLENTVFTFAVVLASYLGGSAMGAAIQSRRGLPAPPLFALLAGACVTSGLILRWTPSLYAALRFRFGDSLAAVAVAETLTSAAVMLLPTMFMGAIFSTLAERSLRFKPSLSWGLALNTSAAALAAVAFGLLLVPKGGLNGAIAFISLGYLALVGKSRWLSVLLPVLICLPLLPGSADLVRLREGERIVFHRDGTMAAVTVLESANGHRVLKVNNRFQQGGTAARAAEERHAYIPLLLHPAPRRALFIGLGTGITFEAGARLPEVLAEAVELLPEIVQARGYFGEVSGAKVQIADGRRFVLSSSAKYDVIVADLFHPAQDGAGFLYTREHFAAVRDRLNEHGLFCQWLPLFQMDLETVRMVTRGFLDVFPEAEAWLLRFNADIPVIGLLSRTSPGANNLDQRFAFEGLSRVGLNDLVRLAGCHLAGPERLKPFAETAQLNTDDHPAVMFRAPRLAFRKSDAPGERLLELVRLTGSEEAPSWISDPPLAERVRQFKSARDLYLEGLVVESRGDIVRAAGLYLASARKSADFTASYAQLLTLASALANTQPALSRQLLEGLAAAQPQVPVARQLLERLTGPPE